MWTLEKYKEVYERYCMSGLSANAFCQNEQITHSRFYYWLKKYRKLDLEKSVLSGKSIEHDVLPHFIPFSIENEGSDQTYPQKKVREHLSQPVSVEPRNVSMEIQYVNGTIVRLCGKSDIEFIKSLIRLSR